MNDFAELREFAAGQDRLRGSPSAGGLSDLLAAYDQQAAAIDRLMAERDEALDALETACEEVAAEFEGDLTGWLRRLVLDRGGDEVIDHPDGWNGDTATEYLREEFRRLEREAQKAEAANAALRGELAEERANMAATMEGWEKLCEKLDEQDGTIAALRGEVERLTRERDHWKDVAAATQMLAHKWSAAHDALLSWIQGWPEGIARLQQFPAKYEYPAPVDLPNALVRAEQEAARAAKLEAALREPLDEAADWVTMAGHSIESCKVRPTKKHLIHWASQMESALVRINRARAALAPATEAGDG